MQAWQNQTPNVNKFPKSKTIEAKAPLITRAGFDTFFSPVLKGIINEL